MKIEPLDDKTVKIVLSKGDMDTFHLTYEEMDYQNPDTKRVLLKLIDAVRRESSVDLAGGKLFIEAFPYADGGCILYVNVLPGSGPERPARPKTGFDTPLVFLFGDLESLCRASARLQGRYSHTILKSSLYLLEGRYCLALYTYFKLDGPISRLLSEYGDFFGKGPVTAAFLREHGKVLCEEEALRTIVESLG